MTFKHSLKKILELYPNPYLHYVDNQSWILYTSKRDWNDACKIEDGDDLDNYFEKITLLSGDDFSGTIGYVPDLVADLCSILNIEVGSE